MLQVTWVCFANDAYCGGVDWSYSALDVFSADFIFVGIPTGYVFGMVQQKILMIL